jgi:hypothetical protein
MNEHQTKKFADVPESKQKMYEKAVTTKSPRKAIKIFCLECCGYSSKEVDLCTGLGCPLYPYRQGGWPGKGQKKESSIVVQEKLDGSQRRPDFSKFAAKKGE